VPAEKDPLPTRVNETVPVGGIGLNDVSLTVAVQVELPGRKSELGTQPTVVVVLPALIVALPLLVACVESPP